MIAIREVRRRFHERSAEWYSATVLFGFGAVLMHPSPTFTSPSWDGFAQLGEEGTGLMIGGIGFVWLIALFINGARQMVTSTLRMICAFLGALASGILCIGFLGAYFLSGILTTGAWTYFMLSVYSLYALFHATKDKRRNG
ncbi:hypothetical protein [Antarcticirhabdus aurantiaca]|uniref:Uncharacterized protein n=1 Tax=Antarcticirhabdus aurantiaca TaxID=2606717 RepID=A0ACD4NJY4_9HYPH|nr:hypothetical protein [Antarcticirhabdus aurantiaca]WAJ27129.1 hypothetical protein OXU80_20065 [Jeongeuplla avenae]